MPIMARNVFALALCALLVHAGGCGDRPVQGGGATGGSGASGAPDPGGSNPGGAPGSGGDGGQGGDPAPGGEPDPGPNVDTSDPQLYEVTFTADEADPEATTKLGNQLAFLDTRVAPRGSSSCTCTAPARPGPAAAPPTARSSPASASTCSAPATRSDYGVGNCGDDIEGCRLEAFEGVDHHAFIDIAPPDSIETRVAKGLAHVQAQNPEGDWTYFVDGDKPKWDEDRHLRHLARRQLVRRDRPPPRREPRGDALRPARHEPGLAAEVAGDADRSLLRLLAHRTTSSTLVTSRRSRTDGLPGAATSVDDAAPPYGGSSSADQLGGDRRRSRIHAGGRIIAEHRRGLRIPPRVGGVVLRRSVAKPTRLTARSSRSGRSRRTRRRAGQS